MIDERVIYLGERRRVTLDAWLTNGAQFSVFNPTYEVTKGETVIESGALDAIPKNKHWLLNFLFEPQAAGVYMVGFKFSLGDETIVSKLRIRVIS